MLPSPEDHLAIVDVLLRYATALDGRDWGLLEACFTPDVTAEYPRTGAHAGRDEVVASVRRVIGLCDVTQHLLTNPVVDVTGDDAEVVCSLLATHIRRGAPGGEVYTVGGRYRDHLVRTPSGWRICHRKLEILWTAGNLQLLPDAARVAAAVAEASARPGSGPG